jgi:hypothetical protein
MFSLYKESEAEGFCFFFSQAGGFLLDLIYGLAFSVVGLVCSFIHQKISESFCVR